MLRFGPNGIPLSCKGRTWLDALYDVKELELEAIEFQLLRGIGEPIDEEEAEMIRETGEELDIFIAVHAPYYMDLMGDEESANRSLEYLKWSGEIANSIGARLVVTHVGFYGDLSGKEAVDRAVVMVRKIRDHYKRKKYSHLLGVEVHGKQDLFGDLEEILEVTKRVSNTVPVVNFAHLHARERGFLKKKEDFEEVFDELFAVDTPFIYTLFSGLEHDFEGNELRFTPIKKGDMRFNPLAELLLDHKDEEIVVISSSPLLEHDAQYMKVILGRIEERRIQKAIQKKAAEEAARIEAEKKKKAEAERKRKEAEKKKKEAEKKKKEAEKKKKEAEKKKKEAEKKKKEAEKKKKEAEKKKADTKKSGTKTSPSKKSSSKKSDTKKSSSKKSDSKKSSSKKSSTKKSDSKKSSSKKSGTKKSSTKKSDSKKTTSKKAGSKKSGTKKSTSKGSGTGKSSSKKSDSKKSSSKKSGTKKSSPKKSGSKKSSSKKSGSTPTSKKG